jgi:biopolymer transport protein ExbD
MLTPLIDVLFLLIIFFSVSSRLTDEQGVDLTLPSSATGQVAERSLPVLRVQADRTMFLDQTPLRWSELPQALQSLDSVARQRGLLLNVDQSIPHGEVIQILDAVKQAGMVKILFGTYPADIEDNAPNAFP